MKTGGLVGAVAFWVAVLSLDIARAGESVEAADGSRVEVKDGELSLLIGGKQVWSKRLTEKGTNGKVEVEAVDLGGGDVAIHVTVSASDNDKIEAVALREGASRTMKMIWNGSTALKGDPGERTGDAVRFDDLSGDGKPEIATGKIAENVRLCGVSELPLLFRQVFDPVSGKLRPVSARRPGLTAAEDLTGSGDPGDGPTTSRIKAVAPASVSRFAGDRGDPMLLLAPYALADGDPSTVWVSGPGNGAGEFATFSVDTGSYGVTRVGVRPAGRTGGKNVYDRPKTLLLSVEGKVFRLVFPDERTDATSGVIWFDLPRPAATGCLSIAIETTQEPKLSKPMALSDIAIMTEVDANGSIDRLAADLSDPERRRQAASLLARAGAEAVPAIRAAWAKLDEQGLRQAAGILSATSPEDAIDLLVEVATGSDPVAADIARLGLASAPEAAIAPLSNLLDSEDGAKFEAAADLLALLGVDSAVEALAKSAGAGGRQRRAFLRSRLTVASVRSTAAAERLWDCLVESSKKSEKERLFDLVRVAARVPHLAAKVAELISKIWKDQTLFEDRYRLLDAIGWLGPNAPAALLAEASRDPDRLIRAAAVYSLGRINDERSTRAVGAALNDKEPEVRLAALDAVAGTGQAASFGGALAAISSQDPWPDLRARAVSLVGSLPPETALPALELAGLDESPTVRAAALRQAIAIPGERADRIVIERLKSDKDPLPLKAEAARAAHLRCQASALDALFELLAQGAEPLADPAEVSAALAAARAIGAIGGEKAEKLLKKAKRRSNPATDKAIKQAMSALGVECGKKKAERR